MNHNIKIRRGMPWDDREKRMLIVKNRKLEEIPAWIVGESSSAHEHTHTMEDTSIQTAHSPEI